jgi:hypothetical protein
MGMTSQRVFPLLQQQLQLLLLCLLKVGIVDGVACEIHDGSWAQMAYVKCCDYKELRNKMALAVIQI